MRVRKKRSVKLVMPKKRSKTKTLQDYCPKCHAFVIITKVSGYVTVAEHNTKRNVRFPPDRRGIHNEDRDAREAEEVRPGVP